VFLQVVYRPGAENPMLATGMPTMRIPDVRAFGFGHVSASSSSTLIANGSASSYSDASVLSDDATPAARIRPSAKTTAPAKDKPIMRQLQKLHVGVALRIMA